MHDFMWGRAGRAGRGPLGLGSKKTEKINDLCIDYKIFVSTIFVYLNTALYALRVHTVIQEISSIWKFLGNYSKWAFSSSGKFPKGR